VRPLREAPDGGQLLSFREVLQDRRISLANSVAPRLG
jgi:hypothetical protein